MTDQLRWGSASFPDKQGSWSDRFAVGLRYHASALALGAAAISLTVSGFLAVGYIRYERLATAQEAAARRAEGANADLQDALARLRDQLGAANQTLTTTQSQIAALSDEAHHQVATSEQVAILKGDRVAQLTRALEQAQRELHLAEAQRATLVARLSKSETEAAEGRTRQQQAQAGVEQWQKKIQQLTADRDKAAAERDQLRARISQLEQKLSLQARQPARPVAQAPPQTATPAASAPQAAAASAATAASPAPAATAPVAVPAVARGGFAQFERVLASTGVDVTRLFAQFGVSRGEGGPFIPAPRGAHPDTGLSTEKLAALVKALPISAPLQGYEIGSPFGLRHDPINGRSSLHTGLDFDAPYLSPVYATAPGTVTFAGYRDDYGKIVEIDHGNGIATRYGHLHRFIVAVGQRVGGHQQIGLLGSTGRATGPHVHYEVVVNGEPQDPEKFLGLARLVRVAQP